MFAGLASLPKHPVTHHGTAPSFVDPRLATVTHVFLRVDAVRPALHPPYEGPYRVIHRGDKTFTLDIKNKSSVVSVDRLKPAFVDVDILASFNTTKHGRIVKRPNYFGC